jgi:RNA ligase
MVVPQYRGGIMRYDFPMDITIDEVRTAVANANARLGTNVFIEADRGDHVIFNYVVSFDGSFVFPNSGDPAQDRELSILRECRGLTFHKNGRLLNRKYHKFFNIGEKPETQIDVIDFSEPHVIFEKLDGSMITPMYLGEDMDDIGPEKIRWCTKMGLTDITPQVEEWVSNNPHYVNWASNVIYGGYTPIFEWCSRKQKIVIDHPEDRLILTDILNNKTGKYLPFSALEAASRSKIEICRIMPGSVENIEQFMAEARDLVGSEGYVIRFDDGRMYKIKGDWYCQIHRTKDLIQREKDVISLIAWDRLDDAKAFMDAGDRNRVNKFHEDYETALSVTAAGLDLEFARLLVESGGGHPKDFAELVKAGNYPSFIPAVLFGMRSGRSAIEQIRAIIAKHAHPTAGTQTRIDAIRFLIGGIDWNNYRDHSVNLDDE